MDVRELFCRLTMSIFKLIPMTIHIAFGAAGKGCMLFFGSDSMNLNWENYFSLWFFFRVTLNTKGTPNKSNNNYFCCFFFFILLVFVTSCRRNKRKKKTVYENKNHTNPQRCDTFDKYIYQKFPTLIFTIYICAQVELQQSHHYNR